MDEPETPAPSVFAYRGQSSRGLPVTGTIDAADHDEAMQMLASMQIEVTELDLARSPHRVAPITGSDFAAFNQQLAHLTRAGLPIESGLRLIAQEARSDRMGKSIRAVADELERGKPLGEAFRAHRGQFPPLYGELIDAGVANHNLPAMLFNLNRHIELVWRLRAAVWQAAAYPLIVIAALAMVLLVLAVWVVPQFEAIFTDFDTRLPALTVMLISSAKWAPLVLIALVAVIAASPIVWRLLAAAGYDAIVSDALGLPLPLVGPVLRRNLVTRWCDAVRVGVDAGMDLPRAMNLAARAIGSPSLDADTARLTAAVEQGRPLAQAASLSILPRSVATAMDLARDKDQLSQSLDTLTKMYREQAETRIGMVNVLLVPILLLLIAIVIGLVVVALFLPLVKLMQSVM